MPFGLHVDKNSQVCTDEDGPIEGLFAVGNVQGNFFGMCKQHQPYPTPVESARAAF